MEYNGKTTRTSTKDSAGKEPIWNIEFDQIIKDVDDLIEFKVYDDDPGRDDLVGEVSMKVAHLFEEDDDGELKAAEREYNLTYDGEPAGTLVLRTKDFIKLGS